MTLTFSVPLGRSTALRLIDNMRGMGVVVHQEETENRVRYTLPGDEIFRDRPVVEGAFVPSINSWTWWLYVKAPGPESAAEEGEV